MHAATPGIHSRVPFFGPRRYPSARPRSGLGPALLHGVSCVVIDLDAADLAANHPPADEPEGATDEGAPLWSPTGTCCPYCREPAALVDSSIFYGASHGMMYHCARCDAYVGTHDGTDVPLGIPANRNLRALRKTAHALFDQLWKNEPTGRQRVAARTAAYQRLAAIMEIEDETMAHIAMLGPSQCKYLIASLTGRAGSDRPPQGFQ